MQKAICKLSFILASMLSFWRKKKKEKKAEAEMKVMIGSGFTLIYF